MPSRGAAARAPQATANIVTAAQPQAHAILPAGWRALVDPQSGKTYFQNEMTHVTQWESPGPAGGAGQFAAGKAVAGKAAQALNVLPAGLSTASSIAASAPQVQATMAQSIGTNQPSGLSLSVTIDATAAAESATDAVNSKVDQLKEWYTQYTAASSLPEHDRSNWLGELAALLLVWLAIAGMCWYNFKTSLFCSEVTATNKDGSCRVIGDCVTNFNPLHSCPPIHLWCEGGCRAGNCHKGPLGRCDCDDGFCWVYQGSNRNADNWNTGWSCLPWTVANATSTTCDGGMNEAMDAADSHFDFWLQIITLAFVFFIFLVGGMVGGLIDKTYYKHHERAIFSCAGCMSCGFTMILVWIAFQSTLLASLEVAANTADALLYIIVALTPSFLASIAYCAVTPSDAPTWSDVWKVELEKKYKMRRDPKTGKRVSKFKFMWNNRGQICSNIIQPWRALYPSRAATFAKCAFMFTAYETLVSLFAAAWLVNRMFGVCALSLFGGPSNFARQVKYSFDQRRRIAGLDYGHFDPPSIKAIKLALHLRYPDLANFSLDLPLPNLILPDLLALLPDLPSLPDIDWPVLQLWFPVIGLPDFPSLHFSLEFPEITNPCAFSCELVLEACEELLGSVLDILLAFGQISLLTDMAIEAKKKGLTIADAEDGA